MAPARFVIGFVRGDGQPIPRARRLTARPSGAFATGFDVPRTTIPMRLPEPDATERCLAVEEKAGAVD